MDSWIVLYEKVLKKKDDFTIFFGVTLFLLSALYSSELVTLSTASLFGFSLSGLCIVYIDMLQASRDTITSKTSNLAKKTTNILESLLYILFMSGILIIPNLTPLQSTETEKFLTQNSNAFTVMALSFTIMLIGIKNRQESDKLFTQLIDENKMHATVTSNQLKALEEEIKHLQEQNDKTNKESNIS